MAASAEADYVVLETNLGAITVELYKKQGPAAAAAGACAATEPCAVRSAAHMPQLCGAGAPWILQWHCFSSSRKSEGEGLVARAGLRRADRACWRNRIS